VISVEIKSYFGDFWKVLCFWGFCFVLGVVFYFLAEVIEERGALFEPFTVGVVDNDGAAELIFLFDFFDEYVIDLEFLESEEALEALFAGDVGAFVELPENFTQNIFMGVNNPFTLNVDGRFPLQGNLAALLASGSIAYLSASQAGIYAALEYAQEQGMSWAEVVEGLLIPVNLAFAGQLAEHGALFTREVVPLVEGSVAEYFLVRFAVFLAMLALLPILDGLSWYSAGALARFKVAKMPIYKAWGAKYTALFVVLLTITLPLLFIVGFLGFVAFAAFAAVFGLFCGKIKDYSSRAMCVFFTAFVMYFASGGIVPFAFLPENAAVMRFFSINHWVAIL